MTLNQFVAGLFLHRTNLATECVCLLPGIRAPLSAGLAIYNLARIIANIAHRVFINVSSTEEPQAAAVLASEQAFKKYMGDFMVHGLRSLPGFGPVFGIGRLAAGAVMQLAQNAGAPGLQPAAPPNPVPA